MIESLFLKISAYITGGSLVAFLIGGWSHSLTLLLFLCLFDWITGVAAAAYEGKKNPEDFTKGLNSNRGFWGFFKKFLMFCVIIMMYRFDIILGFSGSLSLMTASVWFYLGNELFSITENLGRLGVPIPAQFKALISVLKSKSESVNILKEDKTNDKK